MTGKRKANDFISTPSKKQRPKPSTHKRKADDQLGPPPKKQRETYLESSEGVKSESSSTADWASRLPDEFDDASAVKAEDDSSYDTDDLDQVGFSSKIMIKYGADIVRKPCLLLGVLRI
jgi:hypothetical protein